MTREFTPRSAGILVAAIIGASLSTLGPLASPVFLSSMAAEYGGRGPASGLLTVTNWTAAAFAFAMGAAADRWGTRRVVIPMTAFCGLAMIAIGASAHAPYSGVLLLFAAMGIGGSAVPAFVKMNGAWFNRRRGLAFAIANLGIGVISTVAIPQVAKLALQHADWRAYFTGVGMIVLLVLTPVVALLVHPPPPELAADPRPEDPARPAPVLTAWKSWIFWLIILSVCAEAAAYKSVRGHLIALLTDRGLTSASAVNILSVSFIGYLIGQPLAGFLLDKFPTPKVVIPFAVCSLAGLALLTHGTNPTHWLLGLGVMSVGYSAELMMAPFFLTRFFGMGSFGKNYAAMSICSAATVGVCLYLMGVVFDRTQSYTPVLVVMELGLVLGGVALAVLPSYGAARSVKTV